MKKILEEYKDCDSFSLSYKENNIIISSEEKENALNNIIELGKKELIKKYNKIHKKYNLIEFEQLYKEIEEECIILYNKHKDEYTKEDFYEYSFAADFVGEETKYNEPFDFFWELYHEVGLNLDRKNLLDNNYDSKNNIDALSILESDTLKENLIKYEVSFYNHTTISSNIIINYYFKLNDETKELLSTFRSENEIDINYLEDLALYKKNKLVFSSCTNEN